MDCCNVSLLDLAPRVESNESTHAGEELEEGQVFWYTKHVQWTSQPYDCVGHHHFLHVVCICSWLMNY
jgi:hypothetical protein